MRKAPEAFRTISEAAGALDIPAHVLRFWESKFTQVKPVKRAGGRRYYRPADIDLLSGIKTLLHEQGMTIRGVQKLLQEKGARHVAALAPLSGEAFEGSAAPVLALVPQSPAPEADTPEQARAVSDAPTAYAPATAKAAPDATDRVKAPPDGARDTEEAAAKVAQPTNADMAPATTTPVQEPERGTPPEDAAPQDSPPLETARAAPEASQKTPPKTRDPEPQDIRPAPALAALLDAAAEGRRARPLRFSAIAHALRTNPPKAAKSHARALARLEALVAKISARVD